MADETNEAKPRESVTTLALAFEDAMKAAQRLCALLDSLDEADRKRIFGDSLDELNT